jgi:hypothetical protein
LTEISMLAPFIVAAVLCAAGVFGLRWITHNRPTLIRAASDNGEEGQSNLPFDEDTPSDSERELRPQFRKQFEDHRH